MLITPFFTVITVVKEYPGGLSLTYGSLLNQNFSDWEMIIVGTSDDDKTSSIAKEIVKTDNRVSFYTQLPAGIYSAMNFGIKKAQGNRLWFMNAGDTFASESSMTEIHKILTQNNVDLVIGNHMIQGENHPRRKITKNRYISRARFAFNLRISHQAIIFSREQVLKNNGYNVKYKYIADSDLTLRIMNNRNALLVSKVVACVESGGFSDQNLEKLYLEKHNLRKEHLNSIVFNFVSLLWTKMLKVRLRFLKVNA